MICAGQGMWLGSVTHPTGRADHRIMVNTNNHSRRKRTLFPSRLPCKTRKREITKKAEAEKGRTGAAVAYKRMTDLGKRLSCLEVHKITCKCERCKGFVRKWEYGADKRRLGNDEEED